MQSSMYLLVIGIARKYDNEVYGSSSHNLLYKHQQILHNIVKKTCNIETAVICVLVFVVLAIRARQNEIFGPFDIRGCVQYFQTKIKHIRNPSFIVEEALSHFGAFRYSRGSLVVVSNTGIGYCCALLFKFKKRLIISHI